MIDEKRLVEQLNELKDKCWDRAKKENNINFARKQLDISQVIGIINIQPKIGGWIPCSERLPETSEYMEFEPTPHMKRIEISYMTDTVEYLIGFYDGNKWMDKHHNIIKNVIAWKQFLKLPEAYHG